MGADVEHQSRNIDDTVSPINRALDQSALVHDKVRQAAVDLSVVNAVLKDEILDAGRLAKVELALDQSEAVEAKVLEAAADLAAVNDALAEEVDQRHELERRLSHSDSALSASRTAERRARHDALHDAVTRLPNIILFHDRLSNALAQAERHPRPLAVLFVDLDEFKTVNDTHGHDIGDRVLLHAAERLQASIRGGDTASRRGGDEFLVLAMEADASSTAVLVTRLASAIGRPCQIGGVTITITASIGVAVYPEHGSSGSALLKHADMAMYAAKERRKASIDK